MTSIEDLGTLSQQAHYKSDPARWRAVTAVRNRVLDDVIALAEDQALEASGDTPGDPFGESSKDALTRFAEKLKALK